MSVAGDPDTPGDEPVEIGDRREKHVSVITRSGEHVDHGEVYFKHSASTFAVSPERTFPEEDTVRYDKEALLRLEVTQHHAACFITTATAGRASTLGALREFRDDAMSSTPVGRALVALYYAVSPPVARTLERHPRARTTRAVRWLVERCADLARRREASRFRPARSAASILLTLAYAVGLGVATVGHACIRTRERLDGGTTDRPAGAAPGGTRGVEPGELAERRPHGDDDGPEDPEA